VTRTNTPTDRAVAGALGALGFALSGLGAYLVLLSHDTGVPREQLTWLSSAFGLGLVGVAVAGPTVLHLGPERVLRTAAAFMAGGLGVLAVAPSARTAMIGAALIGVGGSAMVLVSPVLLRGAAATARLTRVNAIGSAAGILAPVTIGVLDRFGPSGRLALLLPVPFLLVLAGRSLPSDRATSPSTALARTSDPAVPSGGSAVEVALAWVCVALAVSCEFCFLVWGVARLQDAGAATSMAAALGVAFPIGMAVGRWAMSLDSVRVNVVGVSIALAAAGTALLVVGQQPVVVAAGLGIAGLGIAALYPATLAALVNIPAVPTRVTASLGALASGIAILVAPVLLAAVADGAGLQRAFLLPLPLLALLAMAWVARQKPSRRTRLPATAST